jgi:dihydroflavonol-4-reductase
MGARFTGQTVLITGATGFIGGQVARTLLHDGVRVRAYVRDARKAAPLAAAGAELRVGDLRDAAALAQSVAGCRAVFHFAGVLAKEFKPWAYFREVNVEATRVLAEAALAAKVERFVYASSVWAYGLGARGRVDEDTPYLRSGSPYSDTKREGQEVVHRLARERGLPAVIIQPSVVYGPHDEAWTLGSIQLIRAGRMLLPAGGRGQVTPIYIDDLVEGIIKVAEQGVVDQAYILCGGETVTFREFFGYLGRIAGRRRLPSVPGWLAIFAAAASELLARLTGAQPVFTVEAVRGTLMHANYRGDKARALGFEPKIKLAEGMERVAAWLRQANVE